MFTDAAFHRSCFLEHPLHEQAAKRFEERKHRAQNPTCVVCGAPVTDDFYTTDFLTDEPNGPLREFNYLYFHRAHVTQWPRFGEFRSLVEDMVTKGEYDGPPIMP
jgi:hypothetical protein